MPRHRCPRCGSRNNATIEYGLPAAPTEAVQRDLDAGRISFGGCLVSDRDPRWRCNSCGALFGLPGERAPAFTVVEYDELTS